MSPILDSILDSPILARRSHMLRIGSRFLRVSAYLVFICFAAGSLHVHPARASEYLKAAAVESKDPGNSQPAHHIKRLGSLRFRASGCIGSLFVLPDGKSLVSNNYHGDRAINVWDLASGTVLRRFEGSYEYQQIALSRDGRIVAAGRLGLIRVLDIASGRELRRFAGHPKGVRGLAFSPDGSIVASGGYDAKICLWEVKSGRATASFRIGLPEASLLSFSPDGSTLIVADPNHATICICDLHSHTVRFKLTRPSCSVYAIAPVPGRHMVAAGYSDGVIAFWDLSSGKLRGELLGQHRRVDALTYSADGKVLAAAGVGNPLKSPTICLWDVAKGKELRHLEGHKYSIKSVGFSPDGKIVVAGGYDTVIRQWYAVTGREIRPLGDHQFSIHALALSPDDSTLAALSDDIWLWSVVTGKEKEKLPGRGTMAFSRNWETFASWTEPAHHCYKLCLWDMRTKRVRQRLIDRAPARSTTWGAPHAVDLSPDYKLVASVCDDGTVGLWKADTGEKVRTLHFDGTFAAQAVAFSPDARSIAILQFSWFGDIKVCVTDVVSAKPLFQLDGGSISRSDEPTGSSEIEHVCPQMAYSPDGRMLATIGRRTSICVWEIASRQVRQRLKGHQDWITCIAFSPNCRTLASGAWDNTIRLWDLASGRQLASLRGHRGTPRCVTFAGDGQRLFSGGDDTTIVVWDVAGLTPGSQR
jgi:WD40 repeat protein